MVKAGGGAGDAVDQPMLAGNPARPVAGPLMPQRFVLADAGKWRGFDIGNQLFNAFRDADVDRVTSDSGAPPAAMYLQA
jgi:hypothetical protein